MSSVFGIVDGWEVRSRNDGGFGVYDSHGLISGPHGSTTEAISAALKLPKLSPTSRFVAARGRKPAATQLADQH